MLINTKHVFSNQKGMALLLVLMISSILIAITVFAFNSAWQRYYASRTFKESLQLSAIIKSGINIGTSLIEADGKLNKYDSLNDTWAKIADTPFPSLFPEGTLQVTIKDCSGKFPINGLLKQPPNTNRADQKTYKEALTRLLSSGQFVINDENHVNVIVSSLIDWIDEDSTELDFGAESTYYQFLDPPYESKNGPISLTEDFLLIKGFTYELIYGMNGVGGLIDLFNYSTLDTRININTAPALVIQSLHPQMSADLADLLVEYRENLQDETELIKNNWYLGIPSWPGDIVFDDRLLKTSSDLFEIIVTAKNNNFTRRAKATVKRNSDNTVHVLHTTWE